MKQTIVNTQVNKEDIKVFQYESGYGYIQHRFHLKEIPFLINDSIHYDIYSVFPYEGPELISVNENYKWDLMNEYEKAFKQYCLENNIVSEQVLFDPVTENAMKFASVYEIEVLAESHGTNLATPNPVKSEFSQSAQRTVKNLSLAKNIDIKIASGDYAIETMEEFCESNRDINTKKVISDLKILRVNNSELAIYISMALVENRIIAINLYLSKNKILYKVLTTVKSLSSIKEILIYSQSEFTKWAKTSGFISIYNGSELLYGNTLTEIEQKYFGQNLTYNLCIGKKIWNQNIYEKACDLVGISTEGDYFPAYRRKMNFVSHDNFSN